MTPSYLVVILSALLQQLVYVHVVMAFIMNRFTCLKKINVQSKLLISQRLLAIKYKTHDLSQVYLCINAKMY